MKRILTLLMLLTAATLLFAGCGSRNGKTGQTASEAAVEAAAEVDDVLAQADRLAGQQVTVEGVCTHICQHGGRKIFLMGTDDRQIIRIEAGDKIGAFKPECVNNIVRVTGKLVEDRIDEAYLTSWEQQAAARTAEKHGDSEAGCTTEKQARGEGAANSVAERIAAFRARIAERKANEGKEYLSFYHIDGEEYEILQ